MKFPTTVRYGARALIELAATHPDRAVSVREVGQQQNRKAISSAPRKRSRVAA